MQKGQGNLDPFSLVVISLGEIYVKFKITRQNHQKTVLCLGFRARPLLCAPFSVY